MTNACKTCAFFEDHTKAQTKADDAGLCHFNPPVANNDKRAAWPTVSADDWCGRFEALAS